MARGRGRATRGRGRGGGQIGRFSNKANDDADDIDDTPDEEESDEENDDEELDNGDDVSPDAASAVTDDATTGSADSGIKVTKIDRRKPQMVKPETITPRGRGGGRPPKRGRGRGRGATGYGRKSEGDAPNDTTESDSQNDDERKDIIGASLSEPPKKRGRKPKLPIKDEDKFVPSIDATKRGIMAEGGGCALRRRDLIKSKSRYSPPPFDTPTRGRGSTIKFPSTFTSGRYKYMIGSDEDEDEDVVSVSPTFKLSSDVSPPRRKLITRSPTATGSGTSPVKTSYDVGVSRMPDSSNLVVTLPDGTSIKVDASQAKKVPFTGTGKKLGKGMDEFEVEMEDDDGVDDSDDDDYKPSRQRRKMDTHIKMEDPSQEKASPSAPKTITTYSKVAPKQTMTSGVRVATTIPGTTQLGKTQIIKSEPKTPLTGVVKTVSGTIGSAKLTPKFMPTSKANPPLRRTPQTAKYIDVIPELHECTLDVDEPGVAMTKLPDRIIFLHSELPLSLALNVEHEDRLYLFRQVVSPVEASNKYHCLMCKTLDASYSTKEEKDIITHYRQIHELEVDTGNAKFSEEIVFICLPKPIIAQLSVNANAIPLNAPCQYCGDDARLLTIDEMKDHYSSTHNKQVIMIEQEEILKMHQFFYCCKCKFQAATFDDHHKHMKEAHKMKSYKCKSCSLTTNDTMRLRTHFRAKHMINSANANQQCNYCQGLLIGIDRLNKHIQQSHMVQTGPMEWSCVACRKPCGRGKDLLTHAQTCSEAGLSPEEIQKRLKRESNLTAENDVLEDTECELCGDHFDSQRICDLHQHHTHMKWLSTVRNVVIPGQQISVREMTISDVTSEDDLRRAKVDTAVGHWCRMCDCMVKVYQLFYLHMANFHKLEKSYNCNITTCKAQFNTLQDFVEHMNTAGHNQKTIITHPDEVYVCSYCDMYFPTDLELVTHLLTDQHINKFTTSGHFHRTEPRNYKCKACHTFFGMKESYIHHLETENHQYQCPYCGMTTALPSSRRAHIQNSHPDKVTLCEICGQKQSDVLAHLVTHGYAFECKKCIKKFYWREQLNAHMEAHQDPIICNWDNCGKSIATRSALVAHYRQHKSDYKCTVCNQAFWNNTLLLQHQRLHTATQKVMPPGITFTTPGKGLTHINPITVGINLGAGQGQAGRPRGPAGPISSSIGALQTNTVRGAAPQSFIKLPQVSTTVVKCGNCNQLFKNTKDITGHRCQPIKKMVSDGQKSTETIGGLSAEEVKVLELAAKAATAVSGTSVRGPTPAQRIPPKAQPPAPRSRRPPPKKQVSQQPVIDLSALAAAQGIASSEEQSVAGPTQVIMILNQETGELMEITAPQGMPVSDVINSLNLVTSSSTDVTTVSSNTIANNSQTALDRSNLLINESGDSPSVSSQEQTIMLPANCFNEDGSLTLDAATLSSLNLAIAVDGNGELSSDGNTTFIIDTGAANK